MTPDSFLLSFYFLFNEINILLLKNFYREKQEKILPSIEYRQKRLLFSEFRESFAAQQEKNSSHHFFIWKKKRCRRALCLSGNCIIIREQENRKLHQNKEEYRMGKKPNFFLLFPPWNIDQMQLYTENQNLLLIQRFCFLETDAPYIQRITIPYNPAASPRT